MKKRLYTLLVLIFVALPLMAGGNAQRGILQIFFTAEDNGRPHAKHQAIQLLTSYINELRAEKTGFESKIDFAKHIYYKTHQTFMKTYRQCTSFTSMLREGAYDCVSASALYAILFESLDIEYQIFELPYHIYIEIESDGQRVLLETTDPETGFITDRDLIRAMKAAYFEDSMNDSSFTLVTDMSTLNVEIDIRELAGLHLYNLAINQFNKRDYIRAGWLINQALRFYPSNRILAIKGLLTSL